LDGPGFDTNGVQDEYNPAALEDIPDFSSDTNPSVDPTPAFAALKEDAEKFVKDSIEDSTKKGEAEEILAELRRIKAEVAGSV
jgi:hypothetical protein